MTGIVAALGMIACSAAWRPGMAQGEAAAQADRASPDLLSAAEVALWDRLREQGRPDELDAFLVLFPQLRFAADARRRRDELAADVRQQRRPEEGVYRPRLVRHRVAAYAARAAVESWSCRTALGGRNPCRSISHVAL